MKIKCAASLYYVFGISGTSKIKIALVWIGIIKKWYRFCRALTPVIRRLFGMFRKLIRQVITLSFAVNCLGEAFYLSAGITNILYDVGKAGSNFYSRNFFWKTIALSLRKILICSVCRLRHTEVFLKQDLDWCREKKDNIPSLAPSSTEGHAPVSSLGRGCKSRSLSRDIHIATLSRSRR